MRGHTIFIWGASSVEVEHSVFVYNHNYSLCVIYLLYLSLSCILAYFYYPVCSLKVLGGGRTTVITTLYSEKTSDSWLASLIWIYKTSSGKFGVN